MIKPVKMKKIYLAVPRRYETEVLEEIGKLGAIQLISERASIGEEPENLDLYDRFLRIDERTNLLLTTLYNTKEKFSSPETKQNIESPQITEEILPSKITIEQIKTYVSDYEKKIDELTRNADSLQREIEDLSMIKDRLSLLQVSDIDISSIGDHKFMFVKAGLMNNTLIPKLEEYLKDFNVVYEVKQVKPKESLVIVAGLNDYKTNVEKALTLLNFNEFKFPEKLPPDPKEALEELDKRISAKLKELDSLTAIVQGIRKELRSRRDYVSFLREAKSSLLRTKNLSIIQGWIPESAVNKLESKVSQLTEKVFYLKVEDPREDEEIPVELANKGLLKYFELLTTVQGVPHYKEIDPTLIYAILFPIMYGMMFGDVGNGLAILIWGFLFYKIHKPFLGISRRALNRLGVIMMIGGISAMIFGILYGSIFLYENAFKPLWIRPTEDTNTIIAIALEFGVAQIIIALVLNIINNIGRREYKEAVLSGKGLIGLIYYIVGVMLAINLIKSGLQLSAFLYPENQPLTFTALAMLGLVFFSPAIKGSHHSLGESLMEGFGEFIEVFLSYITNSISYVRLAAFAIAHGVLANFAYILGESIGFVPSLIVVNIMVILIEGFAAGIQSIRLIYYEFSTKFFRGNGVRFKPIKLILTD
ncbi:MAG: V-type ATPase 116kDa subunit family protein [Thermoprotei archaeon]